MWCQFLYHLSCHPPLPLPSPHPSTHHGFTLLCDGACCQLVSSTCRRGSLLQASAGCEIGHLTFVHELCMDPPVSPNSGMHSLTRVHTHTHTRRHMLLWPKVDLYGMAILCGRSKGGKGVKQIIPLLWTGYIKPIPTRIGRITLHVLG